MTSSVTTALEHIRRENDALIIDNAQLRTNNDAMNDEIVQLNTLVNQMAVNSENQIQQIKSTRDENRQLRIEVHMIKSENIQLKNEIDDLKRHADSSKLHCPQPPSRTMQNLEVS